MVLGTTWDGQRNLRYTDPFADGPTMFTALPALGSPDLHLGTAWCYVDTNELGSSGGGGVFVRTRRPPAYAPP